MVHIGDRFRVLETVRFVDGSWHFKDTIVAVTEDNLDYFKFQVDNNTKQYAKVDIRS